MTGAHQRRSATAAIGASLFLLAVLLPAARSLGSGLLGLGAAPRPLSKLDLAAPEGPDMVVPPVLADSGGDDASDASDASDPSDASGPSDASDASDAIRDGAEGASGARAQAGNGGAGARAWTAEEIRAVREACCPADGTDPHLRIRPLTADGGISKHVVQAGGRGPATPADAETVFFHYELYYEDALVASSRVRNGRLQPALSKRLDRSSCRGEQGQDGGAQDREAPATTWPSSWEVILRNMTRGERALVLVTTEQRQRQLVFAPFMAAAANISSYLLRTASNNDDASANATSGSAARADSGDALARKPLRVLVEVLAFGRELLQPPVRVPWPAAYIGGVRTRRFEAQAAAEGGGGGGLLGGMCGDVVYECRGWGRGDASPDFGDEVLLRWGVVGEGGGGGWGCGCSPACQLQVALYVCVV